MPVTVEVPHVGELEFPDGMSDDQMKEAIERNFPKQMGLVREQSTARKEGESIMPQVVGGAKEFAAEMAQPPQAFKPATTFLEQEKPPIEQDSLIQEAVAGLERAGIGLAQGALSRAGIATMAAGAIPGVGPAIAGTAAVGFGAKGLTDSLTQLRDAWKKGSVGGVTEAIGNMLTGAGLIGAGIKGVKSTVAPLTETVAQTPTKPTTPEIQSLSTTEPLTAEALKKGPEDAQRIGQTTPPDGGGVLQPQPSEGRTTAEGGVRVHEGGQEIGQVPKEEAITVYHGGPPNALESNWPKWWTTNPQEATAYGKGNVHTATVSPTNPFYSKVTLSIEDVERKFAQGHDAIIIGSKENPIHVIVPNPQSAGLKLTTPKPPVLPTGEGPGGALAGTVGKDKTQLEQLTDVLKGMETPKKNVKSYVDEAIQLGRETVEKGKETWESALGGMKGAYAFLRNKLINPLEFPERKAAILKWDAEDQHTARAAYLFAKDAIKKVPDASRQAAITKWVDAGGDPTVLSTGEAATKPEYKQAYADAKNLTPDEQNLAENIRNYFDAKLQDAIDNGLLEGGVENYIHRIYQQDSPQRQGAISAIRSGALQPNPSLIRKRLFQFDYEAEATGRKPVQSFAERIMAYDQAFNRAISARAFIKQYKSLTEADGRPTLDVAGRGDAVVDPAGVREATLIKPKWKPKDEANPLNERSDYIPFDHPALRKWKWATEDDDGKPVFVQGDLLVHPKALTELKSLLEKSWFRRGDTALQKVARAGLTLSSTVKQTMLDLSGFHPVQIGVHAMEHRRFSPINDIDFTDPIQKSLIEHGLTVFDHRAQETFSEGLVGSSLTKFIPYVGPRLQNFHNWMFKEWIPRVKMGMAIDALERNREKYPALSEDQLQYLTAREGNAAFGEQNYRDLARHPTYQDALRTFLLAPDFLEARGRFVGQALTRYGGEQRTALLIGAAVMYTTGRLLNKALDDDYHWDKPFEVIYNGKSYSLRTVQEDVWRLLTDTRKFSYNRLNPLYGRTLLEAATGRDYAGRKRTPFDQLKDVASTIIPISLRRRDDQSLWEAFQNSVGIVEKRASAANEIFKMAADFNKKAGIEERGEFIYDPEKDPYRPLKIALSLGDRKAATAAYEKLMADEKLSPKVYDHMLKFYTRPFTGNAQRDQQMLDAASASDQRLYDKAQEERRRSLDLFMDIR